MTLAEDIIDQNFRPSTRPICSWRNITVDDNEPTYMSSHYGSFFAYATFKYRSGVYYPTVEVSVDPALLLLSWDSERGEVRVNFTIKDVLPVAHALGLYPKLDHPDIEYFYQVWSLPMSGISCEICTSDAIPLDVWLS